MAIDNKDAAAEQPQLLCPMVEAALLGRESAPSQERGRMSDWQKWALGALLIVIVAATTFAAGLGLGCYVWPSVSYRRIAAEGQPEEFPLFWEAWQIIEDEFYTEEPLDHEAMTHGAIGGMVASLGDPHTAFLTQAEADMIDEDLRGQFGGIGVTIITTEEGLLRVVRVLPDGAAREAGVRAGDTILEVDGKSLRALDMAEAISLLRGPPGTKVQLLLQRSDGDLVELAVERALIELSVTESRMLDDDVAYLALWECSARATRELHNDLRQLMEQNPRALLLDLRGNRGGYLHVAVRIASQFVSDGLILFERDRDGVETRHEAQGGGAATEIPMAVLVDGNTASAAEIIAGAVRDNGRGILVGERTFGKGSVQVTERLSDGASLRVTTSRWYTPSGHGIDRQGLTPDIEVKVTEEDLLAQRDTQMEQAVSYLLDELSS